MDHSLKYVHTADGLTLTKTVTETADGETNADLSIATATNQEVAIAFATAALKMFYFQSDKAVTLRTNANDGTADNTFAVAANVPLVWHDKGPAANIFTAAVLKFFVQNASGQTATVNFRVLRDATP
jgi:hypothetical protein